MDKKVKILCVDDSADITELYSLFINSQPDLECIGCLLSADRLVEEVERVKPDVVLLDLTMPGHDPLESAKEISTKYPDCRILFFSGYDDDKTRELIFEAGAWGLASKHADMNVVLESIRKVARGETVLP